MLSRIVTVAIASLTLWMVMPTSAQAQTKVVCNEATHRCRLVIVNNGTPGHSQSDSGNAGSGNTGSDGGGSVQNVSDPATPCKTVTSGHGMRATTGGCGSTVPKDPKALCAYLGGYWTTRALGYVDHCTYPPGGPKTPDTPAGATAPTYTPGEAATAAIAQLQVYEPKIGSAPCTKANCKGTVGVPVWLWTQPWETQTASATLGPYTVTATAKISQIKWELGDGTGVTCTTAGTAYDVSMGWATSPDCGVSHGFQKVGTYSIRAVATWQVTWTGAASGSRTLTTASTSAPVRVGEYQALTTS